MDYNFQTVGIVRSCFKEKFGIPRQPSLVADARATLELLPPFDREEAVRGLEGFSHLWLLFVFHACPPFDGKLTVRPPRLGGNKRLGVFATRGTHRPNPVGMSVVELDGVTTSSGGTVLHLKGADLLDGTPILDIKPYLPYADSVPQASSGFAQQAPEPNLDVVFSEAASQLCERLESDRPGLRSLIIQTLQYDPRPAYKKNQADDKTYGMKLYDLDVLWRVCEKQVVVEDIKGTEML